jgi:tryptophan halogenase
MALWRETGRVEKYSDGLFYDASWIAVYIGQGVFPERHDPRTRLPTPEQISRALVTLRQAVLEEVSAMPSHREFLTGNARRLADGP